MFNFDLANSNLGLLRVTTTGIAVRAGRRPGTLACRRPVVGRCVSPYRQVPGAERFVRCEKDVQGRPINLEALCAAPPEVLDHSPSQMPLSCPVAPASLGELHKDGGGGGGGVAGRARAARAPKAKSCATSCGTSSKTPCAASFTCSSFMCHLRVGVGGGSRPGRRAPQHNFFAP